jgi:hypothetical protein
VRLRDPAGGDNAYAKCFSHENASYVSG